KTTDDRARAAGLTVPAAEESYALVVSPAGALVAGRSPAGAFYGLQSLRQLLQVRGREVALAGCRIEDWPILAFRGVHFFPSKKGVPFHKQLISQILARYKINQIVL